MWYLCAQRSYSASMCFLLSCTAYSALCFLSGRIWWKVTWCSPCARKSKYWRSRSRIWRREIASWNWKTPCFGRPRRRIRLPSLPPRDRPRPRPRRRRKNRQIRFCNQRLYTVLSTSPRPITKICDAFSPVTAAADLTKDAVVAGQWMKPSRDIIVQSTSRVVCFYQFLIYCGCKHK